MQTNHFLHAVVLPGGKAYQTGFAIFSSTEVKLRDLIVYFISTLKLYDRRTIQMYMFDDIWIIIQNYAFL